jgi:hypothetical protein
VRQSGPQRLLTCGSGRVSVCRAGPRAPAACAGSGARPAGEQLSCFEFVPWPQPISRTRTPDLILDEGGRNMTRSWLVDSALNLLRAAEGEGLSRVQHATLGGVVSGDHHGRGMTQRASVEIRRNASKSRADDGPQISGGICCAEFQGEPSLSSPERALCLELEAAAAFSSKQARVQDLFGARLAVPV